MAQGVMPASQGAPTRVTGQLRREVGLTALMFISLGSIIGSGWLLGAYLAAQIAGPASVLSWILGGVASGGHHRPDRGRSGSLIP